MAGYDPADSYTAAGRDRREKDYTLFLDRNALQGKRIGVLRALVNTDDADPAVTAVFEQALVDLEKAGAEIVDEFAIANFDEYLEGDYFCARFRYDMAQYLASLGENAPITDVMQVMETGQYSPYIKGGLEYFGGNPADIHPRDLDPPCPDFAEHEGRQAYLADTVRAMDDAGVDAIVYPSWTNPPAHLDKGEEEYAGDNSQLVAPATGLPAVSVPMGYTYDHLPAGLQILGRPYSEGMLFGLAYAYEQATQHRVPPGGFPELAGKIQQLKNSDSTNENIKAPGDGPSGNRNHRLYRRRNLSTCGRTNRHRAAGLRRCAVSRHAGQHVSQYRSIVSDSRCACRECAIGAAAKKRATAEFPLRVPGKRIRPIRFPFA